MTPAKSRDVLRQLYESAQDAPPTPSVPEQVALIAADEVDRLRARNVILEKTVKRLEFRLAAADGALQGLSRRLMAFYEATPDNLAIVKALNAETAQSTHKENNA